MWLVWARPSAGGAVSICGNGWQSIREDILPGRSGEAKARSVEIKEGTEVKDVDIMSVSRYSVSRRVVDSDSGNPVPNLLYRSFFKQ